MDAVVISDSHNKHDWLNLPKARMIIHCGDMTGRGTRAEVLDFLTWFSKLNYEHKVLIAGNHDFFFEKQKEQAREMLQGRNIHYLENSGVEIEGINFWGSPQQPWFYNWAFNVRRGPEIKKYWDLIPDDTDVLITHGPPKGILDMSDSFESCGCQDLYDAVERIDPQFHLFGHIHEGYGQRGSYNETRRTQYINASVLDGQYRQVNDPILIEIATKK